MNRVNYDEEMQKIVRDAKNERLLLHSCCAPCSSACLERVFEAFQTTVFYYNPNVDDEAEYEKRKAEQIRLLERTGWADFLDCDHAAEKFFEMAKGYEQEPERGARCYRCYALRLQETARVAKENGYDYFCTTLSLSPYKNAAWINELGEKYAKEYGVKFLPSDFKKRGGYARSIELSEQYGLYRQDYCGCIYSRLERERKKEEKR